MPIRSFDIYFEGKREIWPADLYARAEVFFDEFEGPEWKKIELAKALNKATLLVGQTVILFSEKLAQVTAGRYKYEDFRVWSHILPALFSEQNWDWLAIEKSRFRKMLNQEQRPSPKHFKREHSLAVEEWPIDLQNRWKKLKEESNDLKGRPKIATRFSIDQFLKKTKPKTPKWKSFTDYEAVVGQWVKYCLSENIDCMAPTPANISEFLADRKVSRNVGNKTIIKRLKSAFKYLFSCPLNEDWQWLSNIESFAKSMEPRYTEKALRYRPVSEIMCAGYEFLFEAENDVLSIKSAYHFQKGLAILMLCAFPLRVHNMASLVMDTNILTKEGETMLLIEGTQTKNGWNYNQNIPKDLVVILKRYMERYRPILVGVGHDQKELFWTSFSFTMSDEAFRKMIQGATLEKCGISINPHDFRFIIPTNIALDRNLEAYLQEVRELLGHKSEEALKYYLMLSRAAQASEKLQEIYDQILEPNAVEYRQRRSYR